jgi:hypothetical protein
VEFIELVGKLQALRRIEGADVAGDREEVGRGAAGLITPPRWPT